MDNILVNLFMLHSKKFAFAIKYGLNSKIDVNQGMLYSCPILLLQNLNWTTVIYPVIFLEARYECVLSSEKSLLFFYTGYAGQKVVG